MPRTTAALATLAAVAVAASAGAARAEPPPPAPRTLHVTGEARVTASPDVAVLHVGVETPGTDLSRTTREAAMAMKKVLAALADAGVAPKDVQTTLHDVRVERPWQNGKPGPITGYTVIDQVRVTVRDLARLGPTIDRVTAAGANALHALTFKKDDLSAERARALAAAYGMARAKAEALARAADVTLGEPLQLGEASQQQTLPVPMAMARAQVAGPETPISGGELEISATVDVTYAIR
jgi:uncharacterized protein YggE